MKNWTLADSYASVRAFRTIDGVDEGHRRPIAGETFAALGSTELDPVVRFDG